MKYITVPTLLFLLLTFTASCSLFGGGDSNLPDIPGKIVFAAKDGNNTYQIYTMRANGSRLRQITYFPTIGGGTQPAWSPDGKRIAFSNFTGATTAGAYLYIMDADGGNMRPLKRKSNTPGLTALIGTAPAWSPDGRKIAYQVCLDCELGGSNYEISTIEVAGEAYDPDQQQAITGNPASDTSPSWSPDGSRIAFVSNRDYLEGNGSDIYLFNNGAEIARLTQTGNSGRPVWHRNGQQLFYWSENNLYNLDLKNSQSTLIPVNIDNGMGFRPFQILPVQEKLLLHVFSYANPRDEESLQIFDLKNGLTKIYTNLSINGADWFIPKNN